MDESPLARLSPELRNRIYENLFTPEDIPSYAHEEQLTLDITANSVIAGTEFRKAIALVQTCRQLRTETRLMFFSGCTFHICAEDCIDVLRGQATLAAHYLRSLGPEVLRVVHQLRIGQVTRRYLSLKSMVVEGQIKVGFRYGGRCTKGQTADFEGVFNAGFLDPILDVYIDAGIPLADRDYLLTECTKILRSDEPTVYSSLAHLRLVQENKMVVGHPVAEAKLKRYLAGESEAAWKKDFRQCEREHVYDGKYCC